MSGWAGIAAVLLLGAGSILAGEDEGPSAGKSLYRIYCLNCHGEGARGDGPMAEVLKTRPADLTRLTERNEGRFPKEEIRRTIDGRREVLSHGSRQMPIWGLEFQQVDRDTNQEEEVRARIRHLVEYLESIQRR